MLFSKNVVPVPRVYKNLDKKSIEFKRRTAGRYFIITSRSRLRQFCRRLHPNPKGSQIMNTSSRVKITDTRHGIFPRRPKRRDHTAQLPPTIRQFLFALLPDPHAFSLDTRSRKGENVSPMIQPPVFLCSQPGNHLLRALLPSIFI